jgi:imidazole glycerol-phosphate synthase subunit HisH
MSIVALIDYGSGNLRSAEKALTRAAAEAGCKHRIIVTSDPKLVASADRIVLPGVGAFADCMSGLAALPGLCETLADVVTVKGVPFLGICVGMQLLASVGREFGDHEGLGWIAGQVVKMSPTDKTLKIPHMGWNTLSLTRPHPLLTGIGAKVDVYFVHSYTIKPDNPAHILATTDYGGTVVAAVGRDNIAGFQFHPEKSQAVGQIILRNFLNWRP